MAMARVPLVVHERLGTWARQLRPRVVSWPVRLIESRSAGALAAAVARAACPLVVIDLGDRPRAGLEDLDRAVRSSPNALVLVLDPTAQPSVARLARELGATHILPGTAPPPAIVALLARWLTLARRRAEADGWAGEPEPEPEPWERPATTGS
jgi:DNA-binding NarL/FixJ family response regulator